MKFLFQKLFFSLGLMIMVTASNAQAADIISYSVLKLPYELRSEEPWLKIINSPEKWQAFYQQLFSDTLFDPPTAIVAPQIDFEHYQIVAGGLGMRASGGYAVLVANVDETDEAVYLQVLELNPGSGCLVTMALTYPSTAILLKKSDKPIHLTMTKLINECAF